MSNKKKLIIIDGAPASGKTTLTRELSAGLHIPYLSKDEFKETLFDELGIKDQKWSESLGKASFEIMWLAADKMLRACPALMIETAFSARHSTPRILDLARNHQTDGLLVHLHCSTRTRCTRMDDRVSRGDRHPGHYDVTDRIKVKLGMRLPETWIADSRDPLPLPFELLECDTEDFASFDFQGLAMRLREFLDR